MTYSKLFMLPLVWLLSAPAFADEIQPQHVVELFTSQGCSSCPPANEFASRAANDAETLVLTYGVTYWDFLGWKDTFAAPEFTERQKAYGRAFGSSNVYTPQLILNGSAHSSLYSDKDVESMPLPKKRPEISLSQDDGVLTAKHDGAKGALNALAILVEYVSGPQSVSVSSGENHGRVLTLTNVVTNVTPLGLWTTQPALRTGISAQDGKSYALLLHDPDNFKLVSALRF